MNILTPILLLPCITLITICLLRNNRFIRWVSAGGAVAQLLYVVWVAYLFGVGTNQYELSSASFDGPTLNWFTPINICFSYSADGISLVMLLLTSLVVLCGVLVSFKIETGVKEFFFLFTLLGLGAYGFFLSTDLFMLFFFLELAVIPKYLLIGMFGSGNKERNATKLALMLTAGSALIFVGIVALYFLTGEHTGVYTWNLTRLASLELPHSIQWPLYLLLFTGFGIFTALFPFHSWAPDGHSSAPTAASMFLAGVSMKLGGYGCLRVANYLLPQAAAALSPLFITLATISILYGAFVTLRQRDLKYMNAFSSVSHCGFVVLGISMLTPSALTGAVLQMVSHGVMTALFFAVVGMVYQRAHTRNMDQLGGILTTAPYLGSVLLLVGFCSLGLPGMSGFVAEMSILVGAWQRVEWTHRVATILACSSIVVTAVYILRAVGKVVWGTPRDGSAVVATDATAAERWASALLVAALFLVGLAPFLLTRFIQEGSELMAKRFF